MALDYRPTLLIILDGFGIATPGDTNAVSSAKKPFFDSLLKNYPSMLLEASGINVGLPQGEVGNSEVGHVTIGSGILRYQSLPRINRSISKGEFFKLQPLMQVVKQVKKTNCKLHFVGLIGNGGIHSSQEHLEALITLAKKSGVNKNTYLHVFLDGRDTSKDIGENFMKDLLKFSKKNKIAGIASLCGRFYAMDRNKNWDRIAKAYEAIVMGTGKKHTDPVKAIKESYAQNVFDEEFEPVTFYEKDKPVATIDDNDIVVFFNFRADRGRQLTQAIVDPKFNKFKTKPFKNLRMVTFAEYEKGLPVEVLFPPEVVKTPLAKVVSDYNLKQLHIAETEKYAHVTFFFNGMIEEKFSGEERILVPSPNVTSYDQKPEMSADKVTAEILKALKADKHDFLFVNYANPDMVAHSGNLKATIKAVEAVDASLAQIVPEALKNKGSVFIVGDHGNAEELVNPLTGEIDKEHNIYPVPFLICNNRFLGKPNKDIAGNDMSLLTPLGVLSDVAPTMLKVVGLDANKEMTGNSLV